MSKSTSFPRENILVFHPSSTKLRFGRSNDPEPIIIPHCIARKVKSSSNCNIVRQPLIPDNRSATSMNTKFNNAIKLASIAMKSSPIELLQPFKEQPTIGELIQMNKQHLKMEIIPDNCPSSLDPIANPTAEFVIGQDALDLGPDANYSVFFPFWDDRLSDKYSKTAAIRDLEDIWRVALEKHLRVAGKDLPNYRLILVIPDLIVRHEIRWLVEMLISEMRFSHIVLQQENVCVTYSTGLPTACVVSVHENSISVSCVEEGISIPEGRIKLLYGIGDILSLFHFLLIRIGFPKSSIDHYSDYRSVAALHALFHTASQSIPSSIVKVSKLRGQRQLFDRSSNRFVRQSIEMFIATEAILAGLALFHPALICKESPARYQFQHNLADESEPDDPFDDLYLTLTSRDRKKPPRFEESAAMATGTMTGHSSGANPGASVTGDNGNSHFNNHNHNHHSIDDNSHNSLSMVNSNSGNSRRLPIDLIPESPQQTDTNKALPLNDAIVKSIDKSLNSTAVAIDNVQETSQQLCSVILAGESVQLFPGFVEWLENSLKSSLCQCGEVEVINNDFTDGVSACAAAWKGATMITLVGYCDDLWISAKDWVKYGSRAIREKAPFLW